MTTPHEADIINQDRQAQARLLREQLESIGIQVRIQEFTGDSSFPVEYRLRYWKIEGTGPTMDMATAAFVEKLLRFVPSEMR